MGLPIGADLRPSARTGMGTPGLGGMLLAAAGAVAMGVGLVRRSIPGAVVALVGAGLAYRGLTGMSIAERLRDSDGRIHPPFGLSTPMRPPASEVVSSTISINRDPEPVYLFWRNPANLTLVDGLVAHVAPAGDGLERWWLDGRGGVGDAVDMRLVEEVPLERLTWRSPDGESYFTVELRATPRGLTEVLVAARLPRASAVPRPIRGLVEPLPQAQLDEMLRKARALLEAGEVPTIEGQPSGREGPTDMTGGGIG